MCLAEQNKIVVGLLSYCIVYFITDELATAIFKC